jgi:pimeloyl-ACP methyl ester carboxylesterase
LVQSRDDHKTNERPAMNEQFCDVGRGITLCYETFGDPTKPPLLLVMGLGMQMIAWDEDFCLQLAERGFYVVRFDNRDAGRSTHLAGRVPTARELLRRRAAPGQYLLTDMATDAAELLRRLDLAPAHVVGVSMGGMIAQTMAAEQPSAVRSLVSIMSTTGNRWLGQPALRVYPYLLARPARDRDEHIERAIRIFTVIGSTKFPRDVHQLRERAALSYDRDSDPRGVGRQLGAIVASGDRAEQLRAIKAPTLVIHGTRDRMVAFSGGRATARAIRGSRLMPIEGLGHDLPPSVWPLIIDAIATHATRADSRTSEPVSGSSR